MEEIRGRRGGREEACEEAFSLVVRLSLSLARGWRAACFSRVGTAKIVKKAKELPSFACVRYKSTRGRKKGNEKLRVLLKTCVREEKGRYRCCLLIRASTKRNGTGGIVRACVGRKGKCPCVERR